MFPIPFFSKCLWLLPGETKVRRRHAHLDVGGKEREKKGGMDETFFGGEVAVHTKSPPELNHVSSYIPKIAPKEAEKRPKRASLCVCLSVFIHNWV